LYRHSRQSDAATTPRTIACNTSVDLIHGAKVPVVYDLVTYVITNDLDESFSSNATIATVAYV